MDIELFGPCSQCTGKCCKNYTVCLTAFDLARLGTCTKLLDSVRAVEASQLNKPNTQGFFLFEKNQLKEYFVCLKREKLENCTFLGKQNECTIYENRPRVCRVYPFTMDENKKLDYKESFRCPIGWKLDAETTSRFRMDIEEHQQELKQHGIWCREWNTKISSEKKFEDFLSFLLQKTRGRM